MKTGYRLSVTGLDITEVHANHIRLTCPFMGHMVSDIYQLPDDQQWDIVICSHTIEHVPEPLAFCRRLRELARHRVFVAAPFEERADILTNGHINIFDEAFLQELGPLSVAKVKSAAWGAFLDPPYEMFIAELEGVGLPDDLGPGSVQLVEPNSATIPAILRPAAPSQSGGFSCV